MKGAEAVRQMRRAGYAPRMVDISTDPVKPHLIGCVGGYATMQAERPNMADLRCVVGLMVTVDGTNAERVHAMRDACIAAGAKRVIAAVLRVLDYGPDVDRVRVVEMSDTGGVFNG